MGKINDEIKDKINHAYEIVKQSNISQNLQDTAFKSVLDYLLVYPGKETAITRSLPSNDETIKGSVITRSLASYISSTNLKSHSEKILMMSYYMMVKENKMTFNNKDIRKKYFEIRDSGSKNLTVEITGLIKKGLIMPAQENKHYMLTQEGIKEIEEKMSLNKKDG